MKKILILFLFAIAFGNLKAQNYWSSYRIAYDESAGKGSSETNPILIECAEHLAYLAIQVVNVDGYSDGKYFKLTNNIDLNVDSRIWDIPIGYSPTRPFRGKFDGENHSILNMSATFSFTYRDYNGLFGYTDGAEIKNLNIDGKDYSSVIRFMRIAGGGLIGYANETTVENCSVKNCLITNNGNVNANLGGLIGEARNVTVKHCSFSGLIVQTIYGDDYEYIGGLIAYLSGNSTIIDCSTDCKMAGHIIGGLIGRIGDGNCTVQDCFSKCEITGESSAGGLIGLIGKTSYPDPVPEPYVTISGCETSGSVVGKRTAGGFIGSSWFQGNITDCIAGVQVSSVGGTVGGFIGGLSGLSEITVSKCRSTGSTAGISFYSGSIGGFVGSFGNTAATSSISECYAEGSVTGMDYVGGFIGHTPKCNIFDCYAFGSVTGNDNVGGFNGGGGSYNACYAAGNVKGNDNVGGFSGVANMYSGQINSINDCYSAGSVVGNNNVGGFVGYGTINFIFTLTNCFSVGAVVCENTCGGFAGSVDGSVFTNCYFDKQTTGLDFASGDDIDLTGINALLTSELTKNSLSDFSSDKWKFTQGYYPQLKVFAESDNDAIKLRSALSVVPLKLANDETVGDVQTIFSLINKTPIDDPIIWTAEPAEKATVVNYALYAKESDGTWYSLKLRAGKAERTILFRPTKNLMTADILSVRVNNKNFDNINTTFTYTDGCRLGIESVFVEILIGGFANCTQNSITLNAGKPQKVTVTTEDRQSKTYVFEIPLSADIFVQRWNDVLAINNNFVTNGGYNFVDYEWYKNGEKISNEKGYIQEPKGLDKSAIYTVTLTTQQGDKLRTCPAEISDDTPAKAAVYPNPVQRGQTLRVETGIVKDEKHYDNTVIQFFDTMGNIFAKQILQSAVSEIIAPDVAGTYILQITENDETQTFKIVVE